MIGLAAPPPMVGVADYGQYGQVATLARYSPDLGLRLVRLSLYWHPGQRALDPEQEAIAARADTLLRRFRVLYTLSFATGDDAPITPAARDEYAAWAADLAARHPSADTIEVGNEPNLPRFWRHPDGAAYAALVRAAYAALHRARPAVTVVVGSLVRRSATTFLAGVRAPADAVSLHGYPLTAAWYERARRLLARAFGDRPVWVTEDGYADPAERWVAVAVAAREGAVAWVNLQLFNRADLPWRDGFAEQADCAVAA